MTNTENNAAKVRIIEKLTATYWEESFNRYKIMYPTHTTTEDAFQYGFAAGAAYLATLVDGCLNSLKE
jgi:hypothetical protein